MKGEKAVVGVFTYMDDLLTAIEKVKAEKRDFRVYSPFAHHLIEHATSPGRSPVRFVNGTGAMLGLIAGFALAIWCAMDWPLRVSAKDVVSIPGFVVIGYECTILIGSLAILAAIFHFCRLPNILRKVGYDPRFSDDKFGLVVGCSSGEVDKVEASLKDAGADEVEVRDGL
ncbi:MAG: DUF3341 domain-containing protein [Candidatus Dadabacteria bacterium]|nr:MAG: DUF3341 domain-containing protein [Candidatus Dadabacteria bacterium]